MTQGTQRIARFARGSLIAGLYWVLSATAVHANAMLTINDGTNLVSLTDGGTGWISFSSASDATWNPAGGWLLNIDLGTTQPLTGTSTLPDMHLSVAAYGQGTLNVTFTDPGFVGNGLLDFLTLGGGVVGSGTGNSITFDSSSSAGSLATLGPFGPGAFSGASSSWQSLSGPYALTLATTFTNNVAATSSLDASVMVPEPGTWALLAAGFLGVAVIGRGRLGRGLLRAANAPAAAPRRR